MQDSTLSLKKICFNEKASQISGELASFMRYRPKADTSCFGDIIMRRLFLSSWSEIRDAKLFYDAQQLLA